MHGRMLATTAALLVLVSASARAQTVVKMVGQDVENAARDIVGVWVAPFQSTGRDWLAAGGLSAASALVSVWDDDVDRFMVNHADWSGWSAIKELREGGHAFTGKYVTPVLGVGYVVGLATNNRDIRDGIFGCLASYASGSILRNQVFYRLISRERPDSSRRHVVTAPPAQQGDQYDIEFGDGGWGEHSWPAGHVANIAACASFLNNRFSMGFVEPVLYGLTAAVGIGRQVDRRHWTSDTVIGIIFGYAIGKEVAKRSLHRLDADRLSAANRFMNGLGMSQAPGGFVIGWSATF